MITNTILMFILQNRSFPGIQESVLALGLNDDSVENLARHTNRRFAFNAYAHFLLRFGTILLKTNCQKYYDIIREYVSKSGRSGPALTADDLLCIVNAFKSVCKIPYDPFEQLRISIFSAYEKWFDPMATTSRRYALDIPGILPSYYCSRPSIMST